MNRDDQITFSVVICTYNGEKTLHQVIDSILKLRAFDELLREVMVVDNASTDRTKMIIELYTQKNNKIKYIFEPKLGLSNARRRAIEADGNWIIYVDDDNVLDADWLLVLKEIILCHPEVGIINGASIAKPSAKLDRMERVRLRLLYRNLACTHIYDIKNEQIMNDRPMGAGLCVAASALRTVEKDGWLLMTGRTGDNLASCEDTELCNRILALGYKYYCDYALILYHLIPKKRLSQEYTDRLLTGLIQSRYQLISNRKHYIMERVLRSIKYLFVFMKSGLYLFSHDDLKREYGRESRVIARAFLQRVIEDRVIGKRRDC